MTEPTHAELAAALDQIRHAACRGFGSEKPKDWDTALREILELTEKFVGRL